MLKEELKNYIISELNKMGCRNVKFSNGEDDFAVVFFDCDNLISFRQEIPDWKYAGIQLNTEKNDENNRKYKIEFRKIQPKI